MLGKFFKKPDSSQGDRVPPGQHLTNGFPIMTYGSTPDIDLATWEFKVWGLAEPKTFRWDDLMALPQHEFTADFHCVTRWSKLDVPWRGFKVQDFLALLTIDPTAKHVMQHCYGGYTTNIALKDLDRPDNFFAFELEGEPLPPEHGGPLRLVVPHLYAWKSAKWINGLEFLSQEELGFWERNGYHSHGEPFAEERYSGSW
ncbi:MAG: sulfite oxidase-like oxidoreductase [Oscillatoriales cyanobacterium]|jgi:DMSO/TMAO reductase YedYZ molybdopterin-dependent catalytic subunit|nr:MAG: sulfite oxidase-like oxidoreductase [Oscillatoriales cyanobacterium]